MTREIPLTRGYVALVDDDDYEALIAYGKWHAHGGHDRRRTVYARRGNHGPFMHTVLTGWPETDHIDGNGLNNQRSNLREATRSQNCANKSLQRNNTSGYKGVSRKARREHWRWVANIKVGGVRKHLGYFRTPIEAAAAYDLAAQQAAGTFAWLNFPTGDRSPTTPLHTFACAALKALLVGEAAAADRIVGRLDQDAVTVALTAAADLVILLSERGRHLRKAQRALPWRLAEPCAYCGDPNCTQRFAHDRLNSRRETTWRERAQR